MTTYENELYHHGILGQKWGVRRYQNPDGTLTEKGRKRLSKQYERLSTKAEEQVVTTHNHVKAYNKTADDMNNGMLDKFNNEWEKKGKSYTDPEYEQAYNKLFSEAFDKNYYRVISEAYNNNSNYQKAEALAKKYNMASFDELVRRNNKDFEELKKKYG